MGVSDVDSIDSRCDLTRLKTDDLIAIFGKKPNYVTAIRLTLLEKIAPLLERFYGAVGIPYERQDYKLGDRVYSTIVSKFRAR